MLCAIQSGQFLCCRLSHTGAEPLIRLPHPGRARGAIVRIRRDRVHQPGLDPVLQPHPLPEAAVQHSRTVDLAAQPVLLMQAGQQAVLRKAGIPLNVGHQNAVTAPVISCRAVSSSFAVMFGTNSSSTQPVSPKVSSWRWTAAYPVAGVYSNSEPCSSFRS